MIVFFDTETHDAEKRYEMPRDEFFRLGQYAIDWGPVQLTTDIGEMQRVLLAADRVVGHNIHSYDLPVIFGNDSDTPLKMALEGRVFDTFTHASIVAPAPPKFTARNGTTYTGTDKPARALRWFGLDNLAFQLGVPGKIADLSDLAKKYGSFGDIPLDDPLFQEYARQDVECTRGVYVELLALAQNWCTEEYAMREQLVAAIDAQNSRNGFTVDREAAEARQEEIARIKQEQLEWVTREYDLPTEGSAPWSTNAGKDRIIQVLLDHGIDPNVDGWPKTPAGAPKLGGDELRAGTAGTDLESFGEALAVLKSQRTLPDLALHERKPDGKVHPNINRLQRSGRTSVTRPGLTIWGSRGGRDIDKKYFTASPGRKLVEMDYSNADARIVAAYSGDTEYAKRFAPGVDMHELTGRLVFGDDYDTDPGFYRQTAKAMTHAYGYRAGAKTLARTSGRPIEEAEQYVQTMVESYPKVVEWQNSATRRGERGYIDDDWGRRYKIDPDRAYTQAPAALGQGGTRQIMCDALIRIARANPVAVTWLVAQIHDALVWDIPEEHLGWAVDFIKAMMETDFHPQGGQSIHFPVSVGEPASDWQAAGHG